MIQGQNLMDNCHSIGGSHDGKFTKVWCSKQITDKDTLTGHGHNVLVTKYVVHGSNSQSLLIRKKPFLLPYTLRCQESILNYETTFFSRVFLIINNFLFSFQLELAWYISLGGCVIPVGFMTSNWSYFEISHHILQQYLLCLNIFCDYLVSNIRNVQNFVIV